MPLGTRLKPALKRSLACCESVWKAGENNIRSPLWYIAKSGYFKAKSRGTPARQKKGMVTPEVRACSLE